MKEAKILARWTGSRAEGRMSWLRRASRSFFRQTRWVFRAKKPAKLTRVDGRDDFVRCPAARVGLRAVVDASAAFWSTERLESQFWSGGCSGGSGPRRRRGRHGLERRAVELGRLQPDGRHRYRGRGPGCTAPEPGAGVRYGGRVRGRGGSSDCTGGNWHPARRAWEPGPTAARTGQAVSRQEVSRSRPG